MISGAIEFNGAELASVPGWPGYYATRDGRIISIKRGRVRELSPQVNEHGYKSVYFSDGGTVIKVKVHRVVLAAWTGDAGEGRECRHLDDDPGNNEIGNLAWGTRQENVEDMRAHGRIKRGEEKAGHKLTEQQARDVLALAGIASYQAIARAFGISQTLARAIAIGKKWAHLREV